jgi:L-lactate dehydrogenase complex protein LldG
MTTAREQMLAHIRAGLQKNRPALEAEAARAPHAPPPFVHPPHDDLVAQFAAELARLEGFPHRCADDEEALDVIEQLLEQHSATATVAWNLDQINLPGLDVLLHKHGVTQLDNDIANADDRAAQLQMLEPAQVALSGAFAGIAESGTLVVLSGAGRGRLASLLPPVHIAVLRREQLVRGLGEALAKVQARHGAVFDAHSNITLITGPSRTGDIEQTLVLGIHGPHEIHVVLIDK